MLSKLPVLKVIRNCLTHVRHTGGVSALDKFDKLRELCCLSNSEKKRQEIANEIRPRTNEIPAECSRKSCDVCIGGTPDELLDLRCKTALILGGASKVGYETADQLLGAGVLRVILGDIDQIKGTENVKKLCSIHGNNKVVFLMTDIREQASVEMAFKEIYKYFTQIDIFINCVGIYNETPQCWETMVRLNLLGCVRGTVLAYKYMSQNPPDENCQGSVIVNLSSYGAIANIPSMPIFSATSNGINGLTSSFGQDFHFEKSRVRCVGVCKSCTDSELLKNMSRHHYDRLWAAYSAGAIRCCTRQSSKLVAQAIVNAVKFGFNGCIYIIKDGKFYRYMMPDYVKIMRQETILW